jgi:hypothetical protein
MFVAKQFFSDKQFCLSKALLAKTGDNPAISGD